MDVTYGELMRLIRDVKDHCNTYGLKIDENMPIKISKESGIAGLKVWIGNR